MVCWIYPFLQSHYVEGSTCTSNAAAVAATLTLSSVCVIELNHIIGCLSLCCDFMRFPSLSASSMRAGTVWQTINPARLFLKWRKQMFAMFDGKITIKCEFEKKQTRMNFLLKPFVWLFDGHTHGRWSSPQTSRRRNGRLTWIFTITGRGEGGMKQRLCLLFVSSASIAVFYLWRLATNKLPPAATIHFSCGGAAARLPHRWNDGKWNEMIAGEDDPNDARVASD